MSVFFNGRLLITPTVDSMVDDSAMFNVNNRRIPNAVAIIGTSLGGIPKKAVTHSSPISARRLLRGGDLLRAVEKAFDPSSETGSPSRVVSVRINPAVQSTMDLAGEGSLSGSTVLTLTSTDYGAHTNSIKVTITKSSSDTTRRVVVQEDSTVYAKSNIGKSPLTVRYGGSETTATVSITTTSMVLAAPAGSTVATLTLANYNTVQELVDAINAVTDFSAVAVLPSHAVTGGALDEITTPASCKATDYAVRADLKAILDFINSVAYGLVTAEVGDRYVPPGDVTGAFMTGGSNGSPVSNQDWQDAFDSLQGEDVQWVVPLSDSDAIWAMCAAHVAFMSGAGQSERRAFVGGATDDTKDNVIAYARALASDRVSFVWPGTLDYDETGALVPYPSYFAAAQVAGGFASMNPGNTMTNKTMRLYGLSPLISNVVDSDDLINGGVLGLRQAKKGFIVSKAITTWITDDRFNRVEVSCGAAVDYVVRTVRDALERFVGAKASPISLYESLATTESVLRSLAVPEPVGPGVIVGDETNPAYRNITAEITGDVLRVWFECSPVIPINYVLVSVYAKPWGGTATLAGQ